MDEILSKLRCKNGRSVKRMSETIIILCALGTAAIVCIIGLVVINSREKKIEKKTGKKPTYYSAVGDWLCGRRR